jgi:Icc-related predicted phosphoesterase
MLPVFKFLLKLNPAVIVFKLTLEAIKILLDGLTIVFNLIATAINHFNAFIKKAIAPIEKFGAKLKFLDDILGGLTNKIRIFFKNGIEWSKELLKESEILNKTYEELDKSIEKIINKTIAENYELSKKNKTILELINNYDEINKKSIKTEEDIEALRELEEQIKDFESGRFYGEGYINITTGDFNFEKSLRDMESFFRHNEEKILNNQRELVGETL